jgi:chromosomal replication initiator protein
MNNSIHVIPLSGKPLEFEISNRQDNRTDEQIKQRQKTKNQTDKNSPKRSVKRSNKYSAKQSDEQPVNRSPVNYGNLIVQAADNGFLVGEENYAVEKVVEMLLDGTMTREQFPIFFYGQSGVGKTHLLQGIFDLRYKRAVKRQKDVLIKAADFTRLFTEAIDLKATDDFRRRFRDVTMLLVDDIEQLENKTAALEEFQHTLDVLLSSDVPVILASRVLPKFPRRLFDRVISGTSIPIMLPGLAVRRHFIETLLAAFRISVSEAAVLSAAKELSLSIPAIYGVIAGMACKAMVDDVKIDTSYFKQYLKSRAGVSCPSIERITKSVAGYFSFKIADLKGGSRNKTVAIARAIAVYLARKETRLTLKQIAKFFGNRDQSTIRHLIEKIENAQKNDTTIKLQLTTITEKIKEK